LNVILNPVIPNQIDSGNVKIEPELLDGICFSIMLGNQISCHNYLLNFEEKAPIYETN